MPQSSNNNPPKPPIQSTYDTTISNARTGVVNPSGVFDSHQDYTDRAKQLSSHDAVRKVALIGRYGAGTYTLNEGATESSKTANGKTDFSTVVFNVTPQLSESGSLVAVDIGEMRSAGSIIIYLGSPARTFNINAKFVSRTPQEASINLNYINILKAWRMPQGDMEEPETIRLFAYDKVLKGIPCMMQNLNIEWSDDVDYIPSTNGVPVPIIQTVSIALKEARNFDDIQNFKYEDFKAGKLDQW